MSLGAVTLNGMSTEERGKKISKNITLVSCADPSALSCVKQACECTQLCGSLESDTQWRSTFPLGLIHVRLVNLIVSHGLSCPSPKALSSSSSDNSGFA